MIFATVVIIGVIDCCRNGMGVVVSNNSIHQQFRAILNYCIVSCINDTQLLINHLDRRTLNPAAEIRVPLFVPSLEI